MRPNDEAGLDENLAADGAATLLKLSPKTVLPHGRDGSLPATKLGRVWRFRRSELVAVCTAVRP